MIDCPACKMEKRIEQLEEKAKHHSTEHGKFYEKFNMHELDIQKLEIEQNGIKDDLKKIAEYVEDKKTQPQKWFEKFGLAVIASIGSMVGTGIVGFIMWSVINIP